MAGSFTHAAAEQAQNRNDSVGSPLGYLHAGVDAGLRQRSRTGGHAEHGWVRIQQRLRLGSADVESAPRPEPRASHSLHDAGYSSDRKLGVRHLGARTKKPAWRLAGWQQRYFRSQDRE